MRRRPRDWSIGLGSALALACGSPEPEPATSAEIPPPVAPSPPPPVPRPAPPELPPLARPERPAPEPVAALPAPPPRLTLELPDLEPPPPVEPPLDLAALERRLKQTDALGVLTKLSLKNQIDDLLAKIGAFHARGRGSLAALRERFDLLVLKVIALLQGKEQNLVRDIGASREAIWRLISDPEGFVGLSQRGTP